MSKHYTNNELNQFANGNFPVKNLVDVSKHIAQCSSCSTNLRKIAPTFFVDSVEQNLIINERHFSDGEITAFLKAETSLQNRLQMSEHFRNCAVCKAKLYQTNPMFLKQTISTYLSKEDKPEKKSFFSSLNALVPIGTMAVLLIGVLVYILLIEFKPISELTQAIDQVEVIAPLPNLENPTNTSSNAVDSNNLNNPTLPKTETSLPKKITPVSPKKNVEIAKPPTNKIIVSPNRSAITDSNCESSVAAITPFYDKIRNNQPTFRWKSVPNATKYNLYISDTAQILLEEAEITETSYKLKIPIEPNKTYKWIVTATMSDGKTINSPSIEFTLGKTPRFDKKKKQNVSDVRCLPKNP